MLTPSLSAADIFSALEELGGSTRVCPDFLHLLVELPLATFTGIVPSANRPPKEPRCSLDQVVPAAP